MHNPRILMSLASNPSTDPNYHILRDLNANQFSGTVSALGKLKQLTLLYAGLGLSVLRVYLYVLKR